MSAVSAQTRKTKNEHLYILIRYRHSPSRYGTNTHGRNPFRFLPLCDSNSYDNHKREIGKQEMYFTFGEIKTALEEHWAEIEESTYPDDWLLEFSNGIVPVYNSQIIDDWKAMPSEYDEAGADIAGEDDTIIDRMKTDLWCYYRDQVWSAYYQVKGEK